MLTAFAEYKVFLKRYAEYKVEEQRNLHSEEC
jgi:hypothetical protein